MREFAESDISPVASKLDSDARVPGDLLAKLPTLGLYGITTPAELGGVGADFLSFVLAVEEISRVSASISSLIAFHNSVVCEALLASTNSELKNSLLPKLATGESKSSFTFDPKSTISCTIEGGGIILNGSSDYVLGASFADVFLVLARMKDSAPVIAGFSKSEAGASLQVGEERMLMGLRGTGTAKISLSKLKLPIGSLVFDPQKTSSALENLNARSRLAVAAQALGIAQASLDEEVRYAGERTQFNSKIGKFYAVQDFIAMDEISIETARSVTYNVASKISTLPTLQRDSSIAKVAASNAAVQSARHSIRVHGGYGFIRDYPVERYLRDARATQLYMESNESLKAKIAESLLSL